MSRHAEKLQGLLRDVNPTASGIGMAAAVLMSAAIFAGSRGLQNFDAALIGYATATVFLAFGVTYRYVVWVQSPPARRYLIKGWKAFLSWHNFRRFPGLVPRALVSNLALQSFIRERGSGAMGGASGGVLGSSRRDVDHLSVDLWMDSFPSCARNGEWL